MTRSLKWKKHAQCQFIEYYWALDKDFWTSGTSKGIPGSYQWCTNGKGFSERETRWTTGHPLPGENCVTIALFEKATGKNSTLATATCSDAKQFICEVFVKGQKLI